jgi:membrane protein YdbS with pleckstrin-like domain
VHIASATMTSGIEAHIDGVNKEVAENIKNIILAKIHDPNAGTSAQSRTSPQSPQSGPVSFEGKVSSENYPISPNWKTSVILNSIVVSAFYALVIFLAFIREGGLSNGYFLVALGIFAFVLISRIITQSIWKKNFYFEFLPEYILLRTGVLNRQENHMPYKSIQNVINKQSLVDRMLGLSTVVIQNAAVQMIPASRGQAIMQGSGISLVWQPQAKAKELNDILNKISASIKNSNSTGF